MINLWRKSLSGLLRGVVQYLLLNPDCCFRAENANLARLLSEQEVPISVRVVDVSNLEWVRSVLEQKGDTRLGVLADLACPGTLRLLHLVRI